MYRMGKDKILHFGVCALVALVATMILAGCVRIEQCMAVLGDLGAYDGTCSSGGFLCGVCIGVGKEYGDKVNPYDGWDWYDLFADIVGASVGAVIGMLILI